MTLAVRPSLAAVEAAARWSGAVFVDGYLPVLASQPEHKMILDRNALDAADWVAEWVRRHLRPTPFSTTRLTKHDISHRLLQDLRTPTHLHGWFVLLYGLKKCWPDGDIALVIQAGLAPAEVRDLVEDGERDGLSLLPAVHDALATLQALIGVPPRRPGD